MDSPRRRFALLCAATLFEFVALGMFLSGLPLLVTGPLDRSKAAVGVAMAAYSLAAVVTRPQVGRLTDAHGRRRYLVLGSTLLGLSGLALLLPSSYPAVIAVRLVQGLAGACFYTAASAVATDLAPDHRRAQYISRFSLFLYSGFAVGPFVGEWLSRAHGFRWTWGVAAACSAAAAVIGWQLPVGDRHPVAPMRRALHPAAVGPGLVLLTMASGYVTITTFAPLFAGRMGLGSGGPLYTTFAVTIIGFRLVTGRLADRFGRVAVALPGVVAGLVAFAAMAAVPRPAVAFAGVALFGAGFAVVFPSLMALTVDRVDERERGEALGSYTAFFDVGGSTSGYVVGAVADQAGFGAAFCVPAGLCALGAVALLRLRTRPWSSPDVAPGADGAGGAEGADAAERVRPAEADGGAGGPGGAAPSEVPGAGFEPARPSRARRV